jgi:hypothetical protein
MLAAIAQRYAGLPNIGAGQIQAVNNGILAAALMALTPLGHVVYFSCRLPSLYWSFTSLGPTQ